MVNKDEYISRVHSFSSVVTTAQNSLLWSLALRSEDHYILHIFARHKW